MDSKPTDNRYIAYARCASPEGASAKLERQIRSVRQLGDLLGMVCVAEVRLTSVSGRSPALRDDLRFLLTRKQEHDDFDALVMEDFARLTRAGLAEGLKIEAEFARCGVRIMYAAEIRWAEDK